MIFFENHYNNLRFFFNKYENYYFILQLKSDAERWLQKAQLLVDFEKSKFYHFINISIILS